eukprot:COSAG01_NODE_5263_length_4376_cov_3.153612_5_plen_85_part_00
MDSLGTTEWEQVLVQDAERRWLAHPFTCPKAGGVRTAVHDAMLAQRGLPGSRGALLCCGRRCGSAWDSRQQLKADFFKLWPGLT